MSIANKAGWTDQDFMEAYKEMWQIRIFEETLQELYLSGYIYGTMHLSIGQEATAVGSGRLLRQQDWITSTHRNHAHSLAKGTDMRKMFAEILGKKTGTNHGKGGSMHIADLEVGNLGSNGIVGAGFPIAAGAALTAQMNQTDQVVICYSGDGAVNEGSFHEALNIASIWQLPVIYFIENNQYGMSTPIEEMMNITYISERSASYGIEGITINGNDLVEVVNATWESIQKARKGLGPVLIEAITYRQCGHSKSDSQRVYRSQEEERKWKEEHDPILNLQKKLEAQDLFNKCEAKKIEEKLRKEIQLLAESVKTDPDPELTDLWSNVYGE